MSDLELPVPAFNLLLALVHLRGGGTTKEFKSAFGFDKVETSARKALVERGLVTIDATVRPYAYELTDAGWLAARKLLSESSPKGVSQRTARILWAVMGDFSAYMERTGAELADVYPPQERPDVRDDIRAAYRDLAGPGSDLVPLRLLRKRLDGVDRAEVDDALAELVSAGDVRLLPESNQNALTVEDRDAAIWLGGEYRNLISIEAR